MSCENKNIEKKLLTISLLVSNRKDTIRKCMESIKPILDAVPSELIVVDTGSTDGSIDIVKEYTDKIVPFVWCKDFSAARNAGLERATGEWFLYLDDDEWFEDVTEIIEFFNSGEYKEYDVAWYIQRNYLDMVGEKYKDCWTTRACKRIEGLKFVSKVHEHFSKAGGRIKRWSCYVHHYGYLFKTEEEAKRHSERNVSLLLEELKENPDDLRMLSQLVQEYRAIKQFKEATELCEKILAETKAPYGHAFLQYIITCLPTIKRMQNDEVGTEEMLKRVRGTYPLTKLSWLVCVMEGIMAAENAGNYDAILKKLPEYFVAYDQVKEMGDEVKIQEVMDRAFYTSDNMYLHMIDDGVQISADRKQYDFVKVLYERILNLSDEQISEKQLQRYSNYLFKMYLESENENKQHFFEYYGKLLERLQGEGQVCTNIENLWKQVPQKRVELAKEFEVWHRKEPIFLLWHLMYCLQTGVEQDIKQAIKDYFEVSKRAFDADVVALCLATPVYEEEVLNYVDFATFKQGVALCLKEKTHGEAWSLHHYKALWNEKYLLYWNYANMVLEEAKLLGQESVSSEQLLEYAQNVLSYASLYFSKEMFAEENRMWLPQNCQFALYVKAAWEAKKQEKNSLWTEYTKKAAKVYPPMITALQSVLKEEAEQAAKAKLSSEMKQLAADIKLKSHVLLFAGKRKEAMELLLGLEQYVPGDREITRLKQRIIEGK